MEFTSTKDVVNQGLFVLVHGRSGSGKTSLVKTIPKDEKILIISAEGGLLPLRDIDISVKEIERFDDMDEVLLFLQEDTEYSWVVLDSLTEIAEKCLEAESTRHGQMTKPGWLEYFWFTLKMSQLVKRFRDLKGLNVVMTALSGKDSEAIDGKMTPLVPARAFRAEIPKFFDLVLYLSVDNDGKRTFVTDCNPYVEAKDRSGILANPEEPSLEVLVQKIYGGVKIERELTPSPEKLVILESIAKGLGMVVELLDRPIEEVSKEYWGDTSLEECTMEVCQGYYDQLLTTYKKLKEESTGSQKKDEEVTSDSEKSVILESVAKGEGMIAELLNESVEEVRAKYWGDTALEDSTQEICAAYYNKLREEYSKLLAENKVDPTEGGDE